MQLSISLMSDGARCRPDHTVSCTHKQKVPGMFYVTCTDVFRIHEHIDPAEIHTRYRTPYFPTSGLQQRYTQFDLVEMTHCQILPNRIS
jgi:hypothetical protein